MMVDVPMIDESFSVLLQSFAFAPQKISAERFVYFIAFVLRLNFDVLKIGNKSPGE
jgi:hypothetical protein